MPTPRRQPEPRGNTPTSRCSLGSRSALATCLLASLAMPGWSQQTEANDSGLQLRSSPMLEEAISAEQRSRAPVFLQGQRMEGHTELETVVQGDAVLRKADTVIRADRLEYDQASDMARASGNVLINRAGNRYTGPYLELKIESQAGFFEQPQYSFGKGDGHGEASRAEFLDESRSIIHDATYTTCRRLPGPSWMPDWILRATSIELDNEEEVGIAHGAYVSFKSVPILPVPAISFPLTSRRKSGLLPPTWGVDSVNGSQLSVPYYWNIAPNRDATITPTLMTARGVDVGAEFRYLEPRYSGAINGNYMPADKLRSADRWGVAWTHNGSVNTGAVGLGNLGLALNVNRVSDDNYWRDFTRSSASLTQRLLPATGVATWARGPLSGTVQVQQWQVLQDPLAPIVPPYDRVPQLTTRYGEFNPRGLDWSLDADFTQFESDRRLTLQPNTQRLFVLAQASRPWITPQGYITPKLQLHASSYQFDSMLANGSSAASNAVPTFSLDAGLNFERETRLWGRDLLQTLEPRAFYVRTPYRDQSALPNYDTGLNDFNFATIYTENSFVGHDKIADNNLLTLGLTTRFLDASSGAQVARFGVAQRLRLEDQLVTLNGTQAPALSGLSDVLLGAAVNADERWVLDSTVQYNPRTTQSVRSTIGARYFPGPYRVLNMAYRFQRDQNEQIDMSWQWPLNDLWGDRGQDLGAGRGQGDGRYYLLGRMNYSMNEGRLVDTLLGLEYDAGCWIGRIVVARTQTSVNTANERLMFQLEFVGFSKVGIDPRSTLTQSIARYQNLRDSTAAPSRFSNYD